MPQLTITVPHHLSQEEALRRVKQHAEEQRAAHGDQLTDVEGEWDGSTLRYRFTVMGSKIKGTLAVEPAQVRTTTEVPFVAMMLKGTIQRRVEEELGRVLEP